MKNWSLYCGENLMLFEFVLDAYNKSCKSTIKQFDTTLQTTPILKLKNCICANMLLKARLIFCVAQILCLLIHCASLSSTVAHFCFSAVSITGPIVFGLMKVGAIKLFNDFSFWRDFAIDAFSVLMYFHTEKHNLILVGYIVVCNLRILDSLVGTKKGRKIDGLVPFKHIVSYKYISVAVLATFMIYCDWFSMSTFSMCAFVLWCSIYEYLNIHIYLVYYMSVWKYLRMKMFGMERMIKQQSNLNSFSTTSNSTTVAPVKRRSFKPIGHRQSGNAIQ